MFLGMFLLEALCPGSASPAVSPAHLQQQFPSQPACQGCLPTVPLSLQEGDHRWINSVARALQLLSSLYGPFGKAYGIGRCAKVRPRCWAQPGREGDSAPVRVPLAESQIPSDMWQHIPGKVAPRCCLFPGSLGGLAGWQGASAIWLCLAVKGDVALLPLPGSSGARFGGGLCHPASSRQCGMCQGSVVSAARWSAVQHLMPWRGKACAKP